MSSLQMPERPVFNSVEPGLDTDAAPPVSGLAILSMILGIFSLTAALSVSVVPFAIVVAILSALLIWKLSRDSTLSGLRLAQIGLFCAIVGGAWGITATRLTEAYLYSQARVHAKLFLEVLASGKIYDAFELTQPEPSRQVTGTDIEAYYKALLSTPMSVTPDMSGPPEQMPSGETMKSSHAKEELEEFMTMSTTKDIMSHGKDAKWDFVRGTRVVRMSNTVDRISVVMVDSANPSKKFQVDLNRVVGQFIAKPGTSPVAIWDVDRTIAVKE